MSLPPGPRRPSVMQLLDYVRRPLPFLDDCARRFGDVFLVKLAGLGEFVFLSSPEHVKQVFTGDAAVLQAGAANEIVRPLVGAHSVLLLDGAEHMRQRRLLLPPFHGERMQAYAEAMRDITLASLARWPIGKRFALHPHMTAITLDVILRTVFGLDEGAELTALKARLEKLMRPLPPILSFLPALQRDFPLSPFRLFVRMRDRADQALFAVIAARRGAPDAARRQDILSLLLAARDEEGRPMSDAELRDELVTLLAAGHETTATSLAWAFERILAEPAVAEKLVAEIERVVGDGPVQPAQLPRLEYLDAVIKETLRLRPILPIVVRRLAAPYSIAGFDLPAGMNVAPCIYLTQRRPDLYPDPERFDPERFVGAKNDPYTWFPFGGGIRRCIGMAFAVYEMKIVLSTVLSRARLRLASSKPVRTIRRTITLAPAGGTPVVLEERRGASAT